MTLVWKGEPAQPLIKQLLMLGFPKAGEFAHLRTAEAGMKCLNSLKQLLGIPFTPLLPRNIQRIEQAPKIAWVEREQPVHGPKPLILPSH